MGGEGGEGRSPRPGKTQKTKKKTMGFIVFFEFCVSDNSKNTIKPMFFFSCLSFSRPEGCWRTGGRGGRRRGTQ